MFEVPSVLDSIGKPAAARDFTISCVALMADSPDLVMTPHSISIGGSICIDRLVVVIIPSRRSSKFDSFICFLFLTIIFIRFGFCLNYIRTYHIINIANEPGLFKDRDIDIDGTIIYKVKHNLLEFFKLFHRPFQ